MNAIAPALPRIRSDVVANAITWFSEAGLRGLSERGLIEGLARHLATAGVHVDRVGVGSEVLDPVLQSRSFIWRKNIGTEKFRYERQLERSADWFGSILYWMEQNGIDRIQRKLHMPENDAFPLLVKLRNDGFTDYYARQIKYGAATQMGGNKGSWIGIATRAADGFSAEDIAIIEAIIPAFGLAFLSQTKTRSFARVLSTYLGDRPAQKVISGQIARGEAQEIEAVVWMSDMQGYTETADHMKREGILEFLNAYAEIVADAVYAHGGEVLKFIGDGVLAVFERNSESRTPAQSAIEAAVAVQRAVQRARAARMAEGKPATDLVVALHYGKVLFGNFGSPDRLDFTALGSAVNEASRLVSLAKTLEQTIITSSEFRDQLGEHRGRLVSLGRYVLRSVSGAHHLYTVEPACLSEPVTPASPP